MRNMSAGELLPTTVAPALDAEALRIGHKLREVGRALDARYLDKAELVRLLLVTLVAGEHMLIVGPPGTAKSALVRHLARLIDARYFEYLLTRFSEPNEIFKSNSAILNALLSILNERRFFTGSASIKVPLSSLFGATNEVPNDDALGAVFDRFLVRASSDNLDSFHFHGLIERGIRAEIEALIGQGEPALRPMVTLAEIRTLQARLATLLQFPEEFLARYKSLCFQIRSEGVTLSDRRIVKLLKLCAASAVLDGRAAVDDGDLFVLRHVWNSVDQIPICDEIVAPVLERHRQEHPEARAAGPRARDLDGILVELGAIRSLLLGGTPLSDVQLFSQLRNLQDIRAALQTIGTDTAQAMAAEVDRLLEGVFESSKWTS
ncbi:MAG: AAA family ATPase [Verrucomicrobiota bacterium]